MIFDMLTSSFDEITNAIHVLKTQDYDEEKVLVLISSVVTWVNTPPNKKLNKQVEDSTDTESEIDRPQDVENSGIDEAGEMIYPFEESDIEKRIPSPKYQSLKTLENAALAAMKTKDNLKVYVLCAGVIYGQGEESFYPHFKQAWLQKIPSLPIIGTGDNIIPTIHVKDLSNMVKRIAQVKPMQHYCFAIDKALNQTQKEIVESISKGVGSGQVHNIELDDVVYEDWAEFLTLNIRMKSSAVFDELIVDHPEENESRDFPWHCKDGVKANISKLNEEFNLFRGLSSMKIYINGPPASGKSYLGGKLANIYDIPHVKIADVVDLAETLEGEEGEKIRSFINTKKDETMEEFEKTKKKGQELSRDEIVVKLPDDIIHKLTKIKLNENACRNKGYILDGFPKTYIDCYHTFYDKKKRYDQNGKEIVEEKPKKPGDEGEHEPPADIKQEEPKSIDWENDYQLNENMIPKLFVQLTGNEEAIKARMKELPEEKTKGTHWTDADQDRRMNVYTKNNMRTEVDGDEEPPKILQDFIKEHKIPHFTQDCLQEEAKIVEKLKEIISQHFSPP